jgi:TP901 family phage tail tape measure protein
VAVANVVAKFEADISDVQAKMATLKKSFSMMPGIPHCEGLVGVASDEVASMGQTIMETSAQFGVGAGEAANALFFITSAGLRGADAMNVLEASMKASQIGLGDVATVADLATSAMNAYGPEVLSATAATDVLTTAVREGKLEASELAGSMGRVLPIASAMGVRFDEVGAAMAAMSRTGTNASEASTQLRGILAALLRPTTQAEEALAGMGLSADGLRTQLREDGLLATLQTLSERFQGNDAAAAQVFGNVRALAGVMDLMGANSATTAKIFDSLTESTGATDKAFAVTSDTAQFRLNQALAEMKTALIEIGNVIMPVATTMLDFAKSAMQAFNSLPGPIKKVAVTFGAIVAALGPILWIGGKVVAMFGTMSLAFTAARTKIMGALASLRASFKAFEVSVKTAMISARTQMGALAAAARVTGVAIGTAFRAAGAAVKGFMASLGPVGLAIIGISVAYEVLAGRSADAEARVDALTEALSRQGDEAKAAAAEIVAGALLANEWGRFLWIENNVQDFEHLAEIAGLSMAEVVTAVIAGGQQLEGVIASFTAAGEAGLIDPLRAAEAISLIQAEAANYVDATKAKEIANQALGISAQVTGEAQRDLTSATVAAALAAGNAAGPMQEIADVTRTTEGAVRALQTAFNELNAILDKSAAQDRMKASLRAMKDSFADVDSTMAVNRDSIRTYMRDAMAFAQTLDNPRNQLKAMEGALKDVETQMKAGEIDPKTSKLYKDMKGAVKAARDEVKEMGNAVTEAEEAGVNVSDAIAQGIANGMSQQEATINAAGMVGGEALETGLNGALGISSPSRVAMQAGRNTGIGLIQGLNQMRSAAEGAGMNVGGNVVRGMITSLNNGKGPVAAAARAVVAAAIAAARDESQEGSPSRVFAQIGKNMMLGLEQGWLRESPTLYRSIRSIIPRAKGESGKLAKGMAEAFAAALRDSSGSIAGAINDVFGSIPTKTALEVQLGVKGAEKFIEDNAKALTALAALGEELDRINAKVLYAGEAFASLGALVARPFGRPSEIAEMFGSSADIDSVIDGFISIRDQVKQAYSVLTDASIVGEKAAARNRKEMQKTLGELRALAQQAIKLREEYDGVMQSLETLERDYQANIEKTNDFYDAAEQKAEKNIAAIEARWAKAIPALETALKSATEAFDKENAVLSRLIADRDQFLGNIKSGFRSFVNSLSFQSRAATKQIVKETKRLADGVTVTLEREIEVGGGPAAIRGQLEERLAAVREFSRNIKTLMARGLDPSLVQDFVSAGVSGAGEAAAALAAGSQDDIAAINSVQSALLSEAEHFGTYASAQWHDVGIAQQQAIVAPLEIARDAAQKALDDANTLRDEELKAARGHLDKLKQDRKDALKLLEEEYRAEKHILETRAKELQAQMDAVAADIEAKILAMMNNTAARSAEAGVKAGEKLLEGFRKQYPKVYRQLNSLMDQLAASLTRTATVTVRTVYEAVMPVAQPPKGKVPKRAMGGPVSARTAYLVGERGPELFVPGFAGNIIPNNQMGTVPAMGSRSSNGGAAVININVNAGMGANGDEIGRVIVDSLRKYERRNGPIPVKVSG